MVVGRDVALRAHLARLLNGAGYRVEIADSARHARRIGFDGLALAIVARDGLGPEATGLVHELQAAVGTVLLLAAPGSRPEQGGDVHDITDEDGVLTRVADALAPEREPEVAAPVLLFAGYRLDLAGHSLLDQTGREILLTHGEFGLLRVFVQRPGRVLSRDSLLQLLAGRDSEPYDRSIDMQIVRLRRKIESDPKHPNLILTVPGSGYKFAAKVRREEPIAASDKAAAAPPESVPAAPERRYVTALAAELVPSGGGGLPSDPEELRAIVEAYRRYASAVVARYGGVVTQRVVCEMIALFGYPVAQEHAAERAVHAGLALAEHLAEGDAAIPAGLTVRVGVASGLVIADPDGEVLGETPRDATRLLNLAEPSQVLITAGVQRLVGGLFAYRELGPLTVKGVAEPVQGWHVLGPSALASRSEALHADALTPLVGREEELALLLRAWQQAKAGEGRLVLLAGEPGIGKSRLLAALQDELATEPHAKLRYFCSPLHRDSALHPVIARWEHEAGFVRGESAELRLHKLEAIFARTELPSEDVALIAAMLSIPTGERYPCLDLSAQRRKEMTVAALYRQLVSRARTQPVLVLFEDAHWADPSSLELLDGLVDRLSTLPVLLVISYRPEFGAPWIGRAGTGLITLSRLDRRQSTTLAAQVTAQRVLPRILLDRIITQTDGIPLFIEESTKAVLESVLSIDDAMPSLAVPPTLQASLMARLDRLPAAKQVAQTGAVIGREFPYALLAAVAELPEAQLAQGLEDLVASGLAFRRGAQPEAVYAFKHAMVRDAAYDTLLRSRRQQMHARVAMVLEIQFPEAIAAQPELIAQHCAEGGLIEKAVGYWLRAGEHAGARSAHVEAITHLRKGLSVLKTLPDTPKRTQQELMFHVALGTSLVVVQGYATPEVQRVYMHSRALCSDIADTPRLFQVLRGLVMFYLVQGNTRAAQELAEQMLSRADLQHEVPPRMLGHYSLGLVLFFRGVLREAADHLQQAVALYDRQQHRHLAHVFGIDIGVTARSHRACTLWLLGYPDSALAQSQEALTLAQEVAHPFSLVGAHLWLAWVHQFRGEVEAAHDHATNSATLATQQGFALYVAWSTLTQGWALAQQGQQAAGIAKMEEQIAAAAATGAEAWSPYFLAMLAEIAGAAGQCDTALRVIADAKDMVARTGQRFYEAELARLAGTLNPTNRPAAQAQAENEMRNGTPSISLAAMARSRWSYAQRQAWRAFGARRESAPTHAAYSPPPIPGSPKASTLRI